MIHSLNFPQTRRPFLVASMAAALFCGCKKKVESQSALPVPTPARTAFNELREEPLELHRVLIDNIENGAIRGSRDGGATWHEIGAMRVPLKGGTWLPSRQNGVLAFDFLRGESCVFATAVNRLHIKFSDPAGYELPADITSQPVESHGVSLLPIEAENEFMNGGKKSYEGLTTIKGGTSLFGKEWSPKVGSKVLMGGNDFKPIPYDIAPIDSDEKRRRLLIVTYEAQRQLESLEFENFAGGKVMAKHKGEEPSQIAKVIKGVEGIGRFGGSEFVQTPGVVRANHAGVLDIGTTNIREEFPELPTGQDVNELRGGFQIVPSHHYQDRSMNSGGDHPFVYMVVGPIQDPPDLRRYDRGIEAKYPLFYEGLRAGNGKTYFRFLDDGAWYELRDALQKGKFRTSNGTVVKQLRGYIKDALVNVTAIRIVNE